MATDTQARLPLSRERILQSALELADENGIESLTMRKLGRTLGFEAMSLYNHVANKDDLLDGMLDLVLAESEPPSAEVEWAAAIRTSASSVHQALRRHPWSCALLMSPGRIRPARLRYMDQLLGRLRQAGFSAEATYTAYHVVDGYIFGFSLWESSHTYTAEDISKFAAVLFTEIITPDAYPYLHEHAQQHMSEGPHREVSSFEVGLDLIVDGLEKLLASGAGLDRHQEDDHQEDPEQHA
jgi:AcrR family transcriptional regulator